MGRAKEEQQREDGRVRAHLPRCELFRAPVEGYGETLCYGCRTNLDKDD